MRVKLKISPDHIIQIREDLAYAAGSVENGGKETLQPYTQDVLRKIVKQARKKSIKLDKENAEFMECETWVLSQNDEESQEIHKEKTEDGKTF
jgi:hypothetical protein